MPTKFDVAIVGLGAMGSAAAYHLARGGKRVVGFDRFDPPHEFGSSHGESRIIREAYWEDPLYVPLVQRAYELWAELERESGKELLRPLGGLFMGIPDGVMVPGCRRSARRFHLTHEDLTSGEVRHRYPAFRPTDDMIAIFEPRAGALLPEACVRTHLELARRHGAELRANEPVLRWHADEKTARVETAGGTFEADHLILCAGAWTAPLVEALRIPLMVERQVQYWVRPKSNAPRFDPRSCPIYAFEPEKDKLWYGFPDLGTGCKVALHHQGEPADPDAVRRTVTAAEEAGMRRLLREFVPDLDGRLIAAKVCLYTNAPDTNFVIDRHPEHENVIIASPCSGHGFKYASVVGEILADFVTKGRCKFDLRPFRIDRLTKGHPRRRKSIRTR